MPSPAMVIRLATLPDLPAIRTLWKAHIEETDPPYPSGIIHSIDAYTRQVAIALAADPPTITVFLALDGEQPVGFLLAERQRRAFGHPTDFIFVHYLYTAPAYRQRGLATQLAALCAEHGLALGLTVGEITYRPGSPEEQLWLRRGGEPFEVRAKGVLVRVATLCEESLSRHRSETGNGLDLDEIPAPAVPRRPQAEE